MRIVCVSDTHGYHELTTIPDGDILVHAGDICRHGGLEDVDDFNRWLGKLPHRHKVVICGNHDWCFQEKPAEARARITNAIYLQDSGCEIEGLKFYGSPWTPLFCDWSFMLSEPDLAAKWEPRSQTAWMCLSRTARRSASATWTNRGEPAGSSTLRDRVIEGETATPRLRPHSRSRRTHGG